VDVIVTTGYADGGLTHDRIDHYQVKAYLEKPVSLDQLEEAVKALKL
jgi:response regulator RpfG family c-di-GMP phosphodiesterase